MVLSLRVASRLQREAYGLEKINCFISITAGIARTIWGGPVIGAADRNVVEDVILEIWEIGVTIDNVIDNDSAYNCHIYVLQVVFMNSLTSFDFLALGML